MFRKILVVLGIASCLVYGDGMEKLDVSPEGLVFKDIEKKEINKHFTYPSCQACRKMIESFNKGLKRTAGKAYDGGNTKWEEENLPKYSESQLRLVEILENICTDLDKGVEQCHSIVEESESAIETWWSELQDTDDLFEYVCVDTLKRCCLPNRFGPDCKPCPGFPRSVCSHSGKCKGEGTRKGNGECVCNAGYTGRKCHECAEGFFKSPKSPEFIVCLPCHRACEGPCTSMGPRACTACKPGYLFNPPNGCVDIDECHVPETSPCKTNQFCVNNDGSYSCLECDRSCKSCDGDGPDMCRECADGYILSGNMCIADEAHTEL